MNKKESKMEGRFSRDKILRSAAMPRRWFDVEKDKEIPEVFIYDQIGQDWWGDGIAPKDFMEEVKQIEGDVMNLHINSPGGFVYDGYSIYNFLNRLDKKINVYVDGIAASIAAVIAMVGDEIIMPKNAELMIHDAWTIMIGNKQDLRKEADHLDKMDSSLANIYHTRTGVDVDKIQDLMTEETYITGEEAVEMGFATQLVENKKLAACAFDVLFADKESSFNKKISADNKRQLEKNLRDAGYSRTEAKKITNGQWDAAQSVDEDDAEKEEPTIIIVR
jgi:ATP-dependent Clp protease protease subunit